MRVLLYFFFTLLFCTSLFSNEKAIFTLSDPSGDDYGDRTLYYPMRDDMKQGDLDLISFAARPTEGGTLFEATFANKIRVPDARAIDAGGMPMNRFFTQGFYTFNIDIYVDTDRVMGSGHTETVPGRVAKIAPASAWERVICLMPRPSDAQSMMKRILKNRVEAEIRSKKGRVDPEDDTEIGGRSSRDLMDQYYFPTRVRVKGQTIEFFVPTSFLGGTAKREWGYVVAVTGAVFEYKIDLSRLIGQGNKNEPALLNLTISSGVARENFGTRRREEDRYQPPIIDLIVPDGMQQSEILRDYDVNTGREVQLPGVVPGP